MSKKLRPTDPSKTVYAQVKRPAGYGHARNEITVYRPTSLDDPVFGKFQRPVRRHPGKV